MSHEMSTAIAGRFNRPSRSEHQQAPAPRSRIRSPGAGSSTSIAAAKSWSIRALSARVSKPGGENGFDCSQAEEPVRARYSFSACLLFPDFTTAAQDLIPLVRPVNDWYPLLDSCPSMSDSPRLDPPLVPGSLLGRYRIDAPLGAGGMGAVFRAHDTTLERPLAIKVLHADADGPDPRQRLLREARSASALNHPAICTVYEVGEDAGRAFIAMEYVDGQPLSARLDQGPLAVREAVQHGIDVADALGHAHSRGIVHRDLKAANAILTSNGRLKLVDFGLARRLDPQGVDGSTRDTIAAQGALVGTPYAMAPEQVRGEPADARSDIWALGVLLFEMLTATRPFRQPALIQLLMSILRDAHEPLARADLPASLRKTIDTCLAKAPESRYQRAEAVRSALERVVADLSGSARSVAVPAGTPLPPPLLLTRAADDFAFVGRERERQQLGDVWKRAKDGRRQLMLIAGEPGIGKTRLSLEFARSCAGENGTVLVGRCDEDALVP